MTIPDNFIVSSFGRRIGRRLSDEKRDRLARMMPQIGITLPPNNQPLNLKALFPDKQSVQMEIGFGAGEHLALLAKQFPHIGFIGCEPYMNGVGDLLKVMEQEGLNNIRLYTDDARRLMAHLPDASLDAAYILFPDPWPKTYHHKRRLVNSDMLKELARLQPAGGLLQLATDHEDYATWMLEKTLAQHDYRWRADSKADWQTPPALWTQTKYQRKTTAEGRPPVFIALERLAASL